MDKKTAIQAMNNHCGQNKFNYSNTNFANINVAKDVWWFDIPLKKLSSHTKINLLLHDYKKHIMYHLCIPIEYFKSNMDMLHVRKEKDCISIELSTEEYMLFKDIRPQSGKLRFDQFLKTSVEI
jgi:hypothetical protein